MTDLLKTQMVPPRPPRDEWIREGLLKRLEQAADYRLVALIAPTGFGKTTVLSQYTRSTQHPVAWITLSPSDSETHCLSRVVHQALFPVLGPLPELQNEPIHKQLLLLAQKLNRNDQNIRLIFDQTEYLSPESMKWLLDLTQHLHEGHQVLLSGYETITPRLGHVLAHGQALMLGQQDLMFSEEETRQYLSRCNCALDTAQVHRDLEGWAAGIALIQSGVFPAVTPEHLLHSVLDRVSPEVKDLLPAASVLDEWSMARFREVGLNMPAHWLSEVQQAGLPIQMVDRNVCRPYRLLLSVLDERFQLQGQLYQDTHRNVARLEEQRGNWICALHHYRRSADQQSADLLLEAQLPRLEERWEFGVMRQVLDDPLLSDDHLPYFAEALAQGGENQRAEHLVRSLNLRKKDARASYTLGLIAARKGESAQGLQHAEEGLFLQPSGRLRAKLLRLKVASLHGLNRLEEATQVAEDTLQFASDLGPLEALPVLLALQSLYLATGQSARCEQIILQGLVLSQSQKIVRSEMQFQEALAELYRVTGRIREAFQHAEAARRLGEQDPSAHLPVLLETVGDLHAQSGHFEEATPWYQQALTHSHRFNTDILTVRLKFKLAESLYRTHQTELAHKFLMEARLLAHQAPPWLKHVSPFYQGICHFLNQDFAQARLHLHQALACPGIPLERQLRSHLYLQDMAQKEGAPILLHQEAIEQLLKQLGHDQVLHMDRSILSPVVLTPARQDVLVPLPLQSPTLSFNLQTLGGLKLDIAGQAVRISSAKSRELLVCLALMGAASRSQLVEALWEDPFDDRNLEYFRVCVRRLRQALTEQVGLDFNPVPYESELYQLADRFTVKVDVLELAAAASSHEPQVLEQALSFYAGDFLPRLDSTWMESYRTQGLEHAVGIALKLADIYRYTPAATQWYRKAIELDPLCEEGYQGLIQHLLEQHSPLEAQRMLRAYGKMLREEYGSEPSPEWLQRLQVQVNRD